MFTISANNIQRSTMNIKSRIEQIKQIALAIPNVKGFKDLNVEALQTDKYIDEPVVTINTESINFDGLAIIPAQITALSVVDSKRETFRDVQDISAMILYQLRMQLLDNKIIGDIEAIEFIPVQADNDFIGFQMQVNIVINPCE